MIFDNQLNKLGDDLKNTIETKSKMQIAASLFSIYGYSHLKKELENIEELNFIFTDPTFIKREAKNKEERFFEIQRKSIEKSIGGSEFEIKLINELSSKYIAKECAEWIKNKVKFKSNINSGSRMTNLFNVINEENSHSYINVPEFSSTSLGYEKGKDSYFAITRMDNEATLGFINIFDQQWKDETSLVDVTEQVVEFISTLYKENAPEFIYYITLYNIFNEFLEDLNEDNLANENVGFKESVVWNKLYQFQKDAVVGIINKLETHNGCILADSVGLGKTFTSLAVIKYYQERNKNILVLCPKKLGDNWNTYKSNYKDNILIDDRFNYAVLYHTDLQRVKGMSNGNDLSRFRWDTYDLIVIDESHNFRNNNARNDRENRYQSLMNKVIKGGVKTKVLMLSATPVNNSFRDLKNQLDLAYEGNIHNFDEKISTTKSIATILKDAQTQFNSWSKLEAYERTPQKLFESLNSNFEFFKLLDSVTIARSRKHIEKCYDMTDIGKFPTRLKPQNKNSDITNLKDFMSVHEVYEQLVKLNLNIYTPFDFIFEFKREKYEELYDTKTKSGSVFKQSDRERSLQKLMRINFMKRLESSVESFRLTLEKVCGKIEYMLECIDDFHASGHLSIDSEGVNEYNIDELVDEIDFSIGDKIKIDLADMDVESWKVFLEKDYQVLKNLITEFNKITPEKDQKLLDLLELILEKRSNPINGNNKKVVIFSAFADTAEYIYHNINSLGNSALIVGSGKNKCNVKIDKDFNNILLNFSPKSKGRVENTGIDIDILVATDCISEGQNLQDCDYLINYDIHWNPVRIIQRFGRIDRIGSSNEVIQLVNFWPNVSLDEYIKLTNRVEDRMALLDMSATGADNVLKPDEETEHRKKQLEQLKTEVIDIEEMDSGISITDLGLNDFRMDLLDNINTKGDISNVASGMHSVIKHTDKYQPGVIYVLKNIDSSVNIENQNQIHPFYLVYILEDGEIIYNHLKPKDVLDLFRVVTKNKVEPEKEAYHLFNEKTNDGKNMDFYSELLGEAIESIIQVKGEADMMSLFGSGPTSFGSSVISGLDDFELLAFLVII